MGGNRLKAAAWVLCICILVGGCGPGREGARDDRMGDGDLGTSEDPTMTATDPETGMPIREAPVEVTPIRPLDTPTVSVAELKTVYFDFDKFNLRADARATIQNNLRWLRQNPARAILMEGHCDERGSEEYNASLGEKRASEVKGFLIEAGIDANLLYTVSYGEGKPTDPGKGEAAWSKNRRVEFKVYEQ